MDPYKRYSIYLLGTAAIAIASFYSLSIPANTTLLEKTVVHTQSKESELRFVSAEAGTVLDVMRARSKEGLLNFSGSDFPGLGFFVEEMDGRKNADGYYWILLINGKKADLGVSQTRVKPGDFVEWKYEKGY